MAAKNTRFAEEAKAQGVKPPTMDESAWDAVEGSEFGGQADIMSLDVGEIGGPFLYIGFQPMRLEDKDVTVHIGQTSEGVNMRLPISASFLRSVDQAKLVPGDKFAVKRNEDVAKKNGKGKGNMMQIYSLKVIERSATGATAAHA